MKSPNWMAFVLTLLVALSAGCKPSQEVQAAPQDEGLGLSVQVLNYMDEPLGDVYVNGIWAGGMASHAGGHSIAGAIGLPTKWHPGLTVEVEWQDDSLYRKDPEATYKAKVLVEPYDVSNDRPSDLWLAFMPGNKIKAVASSYVPGHRNFPGGWLLPFDVCMADRSCAKKFYPQRAPRVSQER